MRLILVNGKQCKMASSGATETSCGVRVGKFVGQRLTGRECDPWSSPFTHPLAPPSAKT